MSDGGLRGQVRHYCERGYSHEEIAAHFGILVEGVEELLSPIQPVDLEGVPQIPDDAHRAFSDHLEPTPEQLARCDAAIAAAMQELRQRIGPRNDYETGRGSAKVGRQRKPPNKRNRHGSPRQGSITFGRHRGGSYTL